MQRRVALAALLGGAVAVVVIILVSGGSGDKSSTDSSSQGGSPSNQAAPGTPGAGNGSGSNRRNGTSRGSANQRPSGSSRHEGIPRRQSTPRVRGRLGSPTGGSPASPRLPNQSGPIATVYTIVVAGGGPVGGVQQIRYRANQQVRLIVQSDAADVVQIPGYGISRRVRAGGSARIYFETSKKGLFPIELASGHARIGVMTVG